MCGDSSQSYSCIFDGLGHVDTFYPLEFALPQRNALYIYTYMYMCLGCGHCKRLAPAYEEVGKAFDNVDSVLIAKVDADSERDLGSRFGVRGFPTLKFFPKGSTEPEE